jgi:dihydrofolate reductase
MNAIVAVNSDWGIGLGGTQSIVIPEDRRHFWRLTNGGVVIAGRKTFGDFGKPLSGRKNIILTRDCSFKADGAVVVHSTDEVLSEVAGDDPDKVFIIGGGEIYRMFLPMCKLAYVTKIGAAPESDTFFPDLDALPLWTLESSECGMLSAELGIGYSFNAYRNKRI